MKSFALSGLGNREENQDVILEYEGRKENFLYAVIDGMGGYRYGKQAAELVKDNITGYLSTVNDIDLKHLQIAINKSNLAIRQKNFDLSSKMGATIGGILYNGEFITYFWIGDVKVLHFRNERKIYESKEHNLAKKLLENGSLTESTQLSKYKHVVTRSISGTIKNSQIESDTNSFQTGSDTLLICSDGVSNVLDSLQIERHLNESENIEEFRNSLNLLLENSSSDNYSFILIF